MRTLVAVVFVILLFAGTGIYLVGVDAQKTVSKVHPFLIDRLNGKPESQLRVEGDAVYVFVSLRPGYDTSALKDLMISKFAYGPRGAPTMLYGKVKLVSLLELASRAGVASVVPDLRIQFDRMKMDPQAYVEGIAADMFRVRQIIGANRVNDLGISGDGVTIAVADTGTDFATPDLRDAVARDASGASMSFDPDGQSYVITELVVHREGNLLKTKGQTVDVWNPASYVAAFLNLPTSSPVEKVTIDTDYGAPGVQSKSGNYHFGILRETVSDADISGEIVTMDFPVVVVDSQQAGVYDTVVVDMSTGFYNFLKEYRARLNSEVYDPLKLGISWPAPVAAWNDHDFADEPSHTTSQGNDIISLDVTKDGVADFTAGILAYGVDLGGRTGKDFALLPPIDPSGNFINVYFDSESHGTSTASNAASRGVMTQDIYKNKTKLSLMGIAPKAKIMGVKVLWLGDVTFGWYYAAGFDWDPVNFVFKYTGKHRADIISNSWGVSEVITGYGSTYGVDSLSQLANALSLPGYLDPSYPGIVMLIAAGNGGFGYGTVTTPSAATLAISVGASTSYAYRAQPSLKIKNETAGGYDDIVPWSARGPTALGEAKPEVVDVGAFGFTDQAGFTGYGDGAKAYGTFGGTSMATPVTAGVVALVVEEFRKTHNGNTPSPDIVKSILSSSATDLSYDVFTQGSGRVNAFDAVAAAAEGKDSEFPKRFYVTSTTAWDVARHFVEGSWLENFQGPVPDTSMAATKWSAGIVPSGNSVETSLALHSATNVEAQSFVFNLINTKTYRSGTATSSGGVVSWTTISKVDIPAQADLMKVTLVYHFTDFADTKKWDYKNALFAQLYDVDSNGNLRRISNDAKYSTTSELVVSLPLEKFQGTPKVRIIGLGAGGPKVPFEIVVRYYQRVPWDWMAQLTVSGDNVNARLTVPSGTAPGVYDGLILLSDGQAKTVVPVSILVPITAQGRYGRSVGNSPFDNFVVYGAFDWGWRYESGDWRIFAISVGTATPRLTVRVSWTDSRTDIQSHLTGPRDFLIASSEYPYSQYQGSGVFTWKTSTGGPAEEIVASDLQPGTYLLVLHNTLFGGSSFEQYPETFALNVEFG